MPMQPRTQTRHTRKYTSWGLQFPCKATGFQTSNTAKLSIALQKVYTMLCPSPTEMLVRASLIQQRFKIQCNLSRRRIPTVCTMQRFKDTSKFQKDPTSAFTIRFNESPRPIIPIAWTSFSRRLRIAQLTCRQRLPAVIAQRGKSC